MNVLFAALLALAPAASASPAGSEASTNGCCMRPAENPPRAPQKRALCFGSLWSLAEGGRCTAAEPGAGSACRDNAFSTLVMVREYTLTWDDKLKQCVLMSSGRAWPTVVATCDGNSC